MGSAHLVVHADGRTDHCICIRIDPESRHGACEIAGARSQVGTRCPQYSTLHHTFDPGSFLYRIHRLICPLQRGETTSSYSQCMYVYRVIDGSREVAGKRPVSAMWAAVPESIESRAATFFNWHCTTAPCSSAPPHLCGVTLRPGIGA